MVGVVKFVFFNSKTTLLEIYKSSYQFLAFKTTNQASLSAAIVAVNFE